MSQQVIAAPGGNPVYATKDALNQEIADRQAADTAEANTRGAADTAEATARQAADAGLQGQITTEAGTRKQSDQNLQNQINSITALPPLPAQQSGPLVLTLCPGSNTPQWGPCPYAIGDTGPGGGIVFYITPDSNGLHGLEAAPVDQGSAAWGCYGTVTGATERAIGTGATNTTIILNTILNNACATTATGIAAEVAAGYVWPNGQKDGFLPSLDELNAMFYNIGPFAAAPNTNVGRFDTTVSDSYYWSSTESDADSVLAEFFSSGSQFFPIKTTTYLVRPARAF